MPGKTVLIVDDSEALVESLSEAFADAGWAVATAFDGEEVFRKVSAYEPDVVLLDVVMPKINGTDVCKLLKAHPRWAASKLVVMSGTIKEPERELYLRLGADDVLLKPFEPADVVALATRLTGQG